MPKTVIIRESVHATGGAVGGRGDSHSTWVMTNGGVGSTSRGLESAVELGRNYCRARCINDPHLLLLVDAGGRVVRAMSFAVAEQELEPDEFQA